MIDIDMKKCSPVEIFKFEKRNIIFNLMYENNMGSKFKQAFLYLIEKIKPQKIKNDLSDLNWEEGKNYHWAAVTKDNVTLLIRHYQKHFTIFFKIAKSEKFKDIEYDNSKYGCFIFHTERTKLSDEESDLRVDNNFLDLNSQIDNLIVHLKEHGPHLLWNNAALPRPDFVEIKNVWDGSREDVSSIDDFIFCCEELFEKYLEHFSMNEMLEKIKTFKVGDMLDVYKIVSISSDVKDEYYHGVGMQIQNTNFPESKPEWADVYSLSRYYYNYIFSKEEETK